MISSRSLFKEEYKKYIWASALTTLIFLLARFIAPLLAFSSYIGSGYEDLENRFLALNSYLTLETFDTKIIMIFLALFMGGLVFSYLHNKKKVDFYHSLPISRTKLFFIKYFIGIFIVIPIMIISNCLLYIIISIILKGDIVPFTETIKLIIFDILFFVLIYSITIFSNILSGNTLIGNILAIFLINLSSIILLCITGFLDIFFENVISISHLEYKNLFNPILTYNNLSIINDDLLNSRLDRIYKSTLYNNTSIFIIYSIATIIIVAISWYLFKIRKSERSGICIAFKYPKTILKYLGVCVGSLLLGEVFQIISGSIIPLYIGTILFCIILHCIVEILYEFDFKAMFKNWFSIIGCIVICFLTIACFKFDLFNILGYVPEVDNVKSVNFSVTYRKNIETDDTQIIENLTNLHKSFLEEYNKKDKKLQRDNLNNSIQVLYKLKNGKLVSRQIKIYDSKDDMKNLLSEILNSKVYIEGDNDFLYVDSVKDNTEIDLIIDNADNHYYEDIKKINKEELFNVIKKDIEEYGIYHKDDKTLFVVNLRVTNKHDYDYERIYHRDIFITDKYKNTLAYLSKIGIEPKRYTIEDVEKISFIHPLLEEDKYITDKEDIEKILSEYTLPSLENDYDRKDHSLDVLIKNKGLYSIKISNKLFTELVEKYNLQKFF